MTDYLLFVALPYVALAIFFVGTIYRYVNKGFSVSSFSSQFLEGNKLFFGSQPFHWGMMVLFFGHLTAFLVPRAIIAWNGDPIRLLILEGSAFAFALCALLGLILFVRRRLSSKRVRMVTSKMDIVVYVVLFIQILTGITIAFTARWGSSWFAAALSPYLKSLFILDSDTAYLPNPEIGAIAAMPFWVKTHVVSAFLIIALVPFTRFMHFLVAPIDYLWRRYQLVIWNWDRREIRNPGMGTRERHAPKNN